MDNISSDLVSYNDIENYATASLHSNTVCL
jgi:hypothetical protein